MRRNVRNIRHSENRLMRNCNINRRNIRRRFESVSLGEALYNEVTKDLNALEELAQKRFEDICKNEYHYKRVSGHIAVEDGVKRMMAIRCYAFTCSTKKVGTCT